MKTQRKVKMYFPIMVFVLVSLSCNFARAAKPAVVEPTAIPVSTEAAVDLQKQVESAAATAISGGPVDLTITEQQLTSMAAAQLQNQPDAGVKNIQVHLQNGQIQITGDVAQSGFNLPFNVILTVTVNSQDRPVSRVVSASVGPLPVPQNMLDQITSQVDQSISNQFSANAPNMVIDDITIADGYMKIKGHTN